MKNLKSKKLKAETGQPDHRMMMSPLGNSHSRNVIATGVQRGPASAREVLGRKPGMDVITGGTGGLIQR